MRSGSETRKRDRLLTPVRCTAEELAGIVARAESAGVTVAQFVREAALAKPAPGYRPRQRRPPADVVELARISGLLGKYGSNLNQIAHDANAGGEMVRAGEVRQLAAEVQEIQLAVRKALGRGD